MQINLNGQITTFLAPDHSTASNTDAVAYVRPHDCDIQRSAHNTNGFEAKLSRIIHVGPIARLEFLIPKGHGTAEEKIIEVQIPASHQRENRYVVGETLLIVPQKVRIFA
jgi:sulfate transport system ATP-binding protein